MRLAVATLASQFIVLTKLEVFSEDIPHTQKAM